MVEQDSSESWESVAEDLQRRRMASRAMGGDERLQKQRAAGKLDAANPYDQLVVPVAATHTGVALENAPAFQ